MKRMVFPVFAALLACLLTACGGGDTAALASTSTFTKPRVTKIVVFVVENHSLAEMKAHMPKVYAFATKYAYASDYTAIRHPSLPNYLAMAGGSTFGVTDDKAPAYHRIQGTSVFGQARSHGKTAKTYAESMPANCYQSNAGYYAVRHNPWAYFVDGRYGCTRYDVGVRHLTTDAQNGTMPNVSFVIPNLVHDAHDGTLAAADTWIGSRIATLEAGPDWKAGRLAIVITADEDDRLSGNRVLTALGSRYQAHKVVTTHLTHYSLTRLIDDVLHVPHLRNAATAPSMTSAFGVKVS